MASLIITANSRNFVASGNVTVADATSAGWGLADGSQLGEASRVATLPGRTRRFDNHRAEEAVDVLIQRVRRKQS